MSCFYKDSLFFSLYTNIYYHIIDNMKKFLIAEAEKARILGMHYNAMGKPMINEQAMVDFGGVFQALPFEQWKNTPEVQAQWKEGRYRTQSDWYRGYNSYVLSKYGEVTTIVQNDPSALIGKTMIVWANSTEEGTLKPSDILRTFVVASIYCGNVYSDYIGTEIKHRNVYFFTQVQTVGDLIWDDAFQAGDSYSGADNKKTNIIPTFNSTGAGGERTATYYLPENNPILGLNVKRPNGVYYVLNTKTMQLSENGKPIDGNIDVGSNTFQPGQYAGLQMPQFNIEKPVVDTKKKRQQ